MRRAVERGPDYDPEIGPDPHRSKPRQAGKLDLVGRLNRLVLAHNFCLEEISAIHHALGVRDRLEVLRRKVEEPEP